MLFEYNMKFYLDQANRGRFILNLLYAIIMTYSKHSICFSGSGYHYPWQVGVALYLQKENYYLNECCFLGVSAGSYVATLLALKLSIREYVFMWIKEAYRVWSQTIWQLVQQHRRPSGLIDYWRSSYHNLRRQ